MIAHVLAKLGVYLKSGQTEGMMGRVEGKNDTVGTFMWWMSNSKLSITSGVLQEKRHKLFCNRFEVFCNFLVI